MRWQGGRKGGNIEDRRGMSPGAAVGGGSATGGGGGLPGQTFVFVGSGNGEHHFEFRPTPDLYLIDVSDNHNYFVGSGRGSRRQPDGRRRKTYLIFARLYLIDFNDYRYT